MIMLRTMLYQYSVELLVSEPADFRYPNNVGGRPPAISSTKASRVMILVDSGSGIITMGQISVNL